MNKLKILFILLNIILSVSCHHNRLKTNEEKLIEDILKQEKESHNANINAQLIPDTSARGTHSLRYKEDRSVDPSHPPVIIDIAGNLDNIREINLSDVFTEIKYIRIQPPPDSAFKNFVGFRYYLTDNSIIAFNVFGLIHYARDGRYIKTIVKNEFTKIEVTAKLYNVLL